MLVENKQIDNMGDLGVDDGMKKYLRSDNIDLIKLAQVSIGKRAFVNLVINLQVPYKQENFFTSCITTVEGQFFIMRAVKKKVRCTYRYKGDQRH